MNSNRFIEKCKREPAMLRGLLFARVVGERYGKDTLAGLELMRQIYMVYRQEAEFARDILLWLDEPSTSDEDLGEDNCRMGKTGC